MINVNIQTTTEGHGEGMLSSTGTNRSAARNDRFAQVRVAICVRPAKKQCTKGSYPAKGQFNDRPEQIREHVALRIEGTRRNCSLRGHNGGTDCCGETCTTIAHQLSLNSKVTSDVERSASTATIEAAVV